ncbi:MAG: MBL fold metallo-hydrolase [Melioribacteraceae bacterium]|nr:MBL fold metallo-hydrolase [Melioribacteraceae bacterium]
MFQMKKFIFSPFQENTYVVWDSESKQAAVIDPGCYDETEKNKLKDFIYHNKLDLKILFNTHCHIDHIFGNKFIMDNFKPLFYAPEKDIPLLENMPEQAKLFQLTVDESPKPDLYLTEELEVTIGDLIASFIFTPGHTPGEYSILFKNENICFTGDVLFFEGIGRTDLWGGDYNTLMNSIKTKLLTLKDITEIHPGHGASSSIEYERLNNPFLN